MKRLSGIALAGILMMSAACVRDAPERFPKARPEAKPGGSITVGITRPGSIEPSNAFEPAGSLVVQTMCDALIDFDPATGEMRPAIAESWQFLDDGHRMILKLRKGVLFHDGRELKAEDVVYSLSRVADRDYASNVATLIQPIDGFELMHGEEETDNEEFRQRLRGVRSTEAYGVELSLGQFQADFFKILGHPLASPISKAAAQADADAFARRPVCAGPYRMAEPWDETDPSIKLTRFKEYYGRNLAYSRGGRGYADNIEFRIDPDPGSSFGAYQAGNSDVVAVPPERIADARPMPGFFQVPAGTVEYIGLPTTLEPFDKPEVRQALSRAIDRKKIVDDVFGAGRLPATGVLPPAVGDIYRKDACPEQVPPTGDVAGAKQLISASPLDGKTLKIYFNDEFQNRALVEAVGAQWRDAFGVVVEPTAMSWDEYLARASGQSGFDGAFRMSWDALYPSADRFLYSLFHSDSIGVNNFTRFSSASFDRLLERSARRALSEEEIRIEYRRLEKMICASMPAIPVTFGGREYVFRGERLASATGVLGNIAFGQPLLRELYVSAQ